MSKFTRIDPTTLQSSDDDESTLHPDDEHSDLVAAPSWGSTADELLNAISGRHRRKKRATLLHLADAVLLNNSFASVHRRPNCGSSVSHYKWRKTDVDYELAYQHLVGDPDTPGLGRMQREHELDADERRGITALAEARTLLQIYSADAVRTLVEALDANYRTGPAWRERIAAAIALLDRADYDTAAKGGLKVTTVEQAILHVYGRDDNNPVDVDTVEGEYTVDSDPPSLAAGKGHGSDDNASVDQGVDQGRSHGSDELPLEAQELERLRSKLELLTQADAQPPE